MIKVPHDDSQPARQSNRRLQENATTANSFQGIHSLCIRARSFSLHNAALRRLLPVGFTNS